MGLSTLDLRSIAAAGGGLVLDARPFSALDLRSIAASSKSGNAKLTLQNVGHLSALDLRSIAASGGGAVVFDFSRLD